MADSEYDYDYLFGDLEPRENNFDEDDCADDCERDAGLQSAADDLEEQESPRLFGDNDEPPCSECGGWHVMRICLDCGEIACVSCCCDDVDL